MLRLVFGRAGSGKSEYCLNRAAQLAAAGRSAIIVVPEQNSYAFERALALRLPGPAAAHVHVKSFRSLCADIFSEQGGGVRKRLDDATRCSLVRRAVMELPGGGSCFRRHRRDLSFFQMAASVIQELKNAGVSPETLADVAADASSPLSREKLLEFSKIYRGYEHFLGEGYADPSDEIATAARLCADCGQFKHQTIFFDGFTGFTEPQFRLLTALQEAVNEDGELCVTLCCDRPFLDKPDPFTPVRATVRRLSALARQADIPVVTEELTASYRFKSKGLEALEIFLAGSTSEPTADGIFGIEGADRYAEVSMVADEIAALVREQGYHYQDIVVVARDLEPYRAALARLFPRFGIPFFWDTNRCLLFTPAVAFILAALDLAGGPASENILNLLKTELCALAGPLVNELEDYLFIWRINHADWRRPFTGNPGGLDAASGPEAEAALARLNAARVEILSWLQPLFEAKTGDGGSLVRAVYDVMKRSGALKTLGAQDDETVREASMALEMLDGLYDLFEHQTVSAAEIRETVRLMAASTAIGDIPPAIDQVIIGTADRMRTDNPRAVFCLGLNDGVFPRGIFEAPLLNSAERELLVRRGLPLSRHFEHAAAMEQIYFYRALTCASERVYLCRALRDARGSALAPSAGIAAFLENRPLSPLLSAGRAQMIVNDATAQAAYAAALERGDAALAAAIQASACGGVAGAVARAAQPPDYVIAEPSVAQALVGDRTRLSATRVETFSQCHFRYFLRYQLGIKPLTRAEINPVEAGTYIHYVMEAALIEFGGGLADTSEEQLAPVISRATEAYIARRLGAAADQPRVKYLLERLETQALRLLLQIKAEQAQSLFRPCDFELEIAENGAIQPLRLSVGDGRTVEVIGKIDRVDLYQKDGYRYIRVVDYKTGRKDFKLNDVYHGLSIQMLLYLFTLAQNGRERYGPVIPAAVMYLPSDPAPAREEDPDAARRPYRMDGLVIEDREIIEAMEPGMGGLFIPVKPTASGGFKQDKVASLERLGRIKQHIENTIIDMARALGSGDISACPATQNGRSACEFCDYAAVCRHDRDGSERILEKYNEAELFHPEYDLPQKETHKQGVTV